MRHPRGAGTFPRVLGRYVREQQWLTLPEAIRKMTSAPAARLRLEDRGRIEAGASRGRRAASTPKTVSIDRRSAIRRSLPTGVEKVFVAGELVWDGGRVVIPAAKAPGRVLQTP